MIRLTRHVHAPLTARYFISRRAPTRALSRAYMSDRRKGFVPIVVTPANTAYAIACAPSVAPPRCARFDCAFRGCIHPGWLYWTSIALDQSTGADKDKFVLDKDKFTYHLACVSQVQSHNLCAAYGTGGGEDVGDEEAMRCACMMRGYASLPLLQRQPLQEYIAALARGDAEKIAKDLEWVAPLKDINAGEAKKPTTVLPKPVRVRPSPKKKQRQQKQQNNRKRRRSSFRHTTYKPGGVVESSSKKLCAALPETTAKTEVKAEMRTEVKAEVNVKSDDAADVRESSAPNTLLAIKADARVALERAIGMIKPK